MKEQGKMNNPQRFRDHGHFTSLMTEFAVTWGSRRGKSIFVVPLEETASGSFGQQILIPEFPQGLHLRWQLSTAGCGGDKAATSPTATTGGFTNSTIIAHFIGVFAFFAGDAVSGY